LIVACVPAFNEERTLPAVVRGLKRLVDKIIVCDDGSTDRTADLAGSLGAIVVRHERNLGYGAAISDLFKEARAQRADVMVTIDGDGQHDPSDIPSLVQPVLKGTADIVIGSRSLDASDGTPGYRKFGIKMISGTASTLEGLAIRDTQSGFRAYSSRALGLITPSEMGMGASVEILMKAREKGLSILEVPIRIRYEKQQPRNPVYHGLDVILALVKHMSIRHPMLFYGVPGFILFILGLGFGFWTLDNYAATRVLASSLALVAVAGVAIGLILMTTGIILWVMVSILRGQE